EVRLVWGLDKFTRVPDRLPAGTTLAFGNSHLMTTMHRDGDVFLAEQEVAPDTQLDYTFEVTRLVTGEPVSIWRGPSSDGGDFSRKLTVENADERIIHRRHYFEQFHSDSWSELRTTAIQSPDGSQSVIRFQARYSDPTAAEVRLVWGLDKFTRVP